MTGGRGDHAAEALGMLARADKQGGEPRGDTLRMEALVQATLAVAEQQRIANLFTALHMSVAGPDRAGWSDAQREQIIAGILDGLNLGPSPEVERLQGIIDRARAATAPDKVPDLLLLSSDTGGQGMSFDLTFEYPSPPLTLNGSRMSPIAHAAKVRKVRADTARLGAHIPALGRCDVTLIWYVTDRRRRDAENPVPTLKAMCDELVTLGVVEDDTPEFMTKHMPVIEWTAEAPAHMVLVVKPIPYPHISIPHVHESEAAA